MIRVRVSYVRSRGLATEADLTGRTFCGEGTILEEPQVGRRLVLWKDGTAIITTTRIQAIDAGPRTWEITTARSVYQVRRLDEP